MLDLATDNHNGPSRPLKVGMLGVGGYGAHRRQLMKSTGLFRVEAFFDWSADAAEICAREEDALSLASEDEVIGYPGLEAIIISTGAKFHADQCLKALSCGLPVFVEKPLCSSPAELHRLVEAVRSSDLPFVVGHKDLRCDPYARRIRHMIDSGALGRITAFEKTTAHSGAFLIKPGDWRGDPEKNPGGMLFQCGVHALHELMFYFGPIKEVSGQMRYDIMPARTADTAMCQLRFHSGILGTLNAYHCTPYRHTLSIFGTEAAIYRDERYYEEGTKFLLQKRSTQGGYEGQEPLEPLGKWDETASLKTFYRAVRTSDPSICYPGIMDGARAVAVTFAAEESSRTGGQVLLDKYLTEDASLNLHAFAHENI